MKLHTTIADPAGNITAFVADQTSPKDYSVLANRLMQNTTLGIEQVGFICPPRLGGAARLEMMGGEFCGNALRSFGLYTAMRQGRSQGEIQVEISGAPLPLTVKFDAAAHCAKAKMPCPIGSDHLSVDGLGSFTVLHFDGISHVLVPAHAASKETTAEILAAARAVFSFDALGVLFLDFASMSMTPAVYVSATDSTVFESSCGSGSTAVGAFLAAREAHDGVFHYVLRQPGGSLEITAERRDGQIVALWMGGQVTLSDEMLLSV